MTGATGMMETAASMRLSAGRVEPLAEKPLTPDALKEKFRRTSVRGSAARSACTPNFATEHLIYRQVCALGGAGGKP